MPLLYTSVWELTSPLFNRSTTGLSSNVHVMYQQPDLYDVLTPSCQVTKQHRMTKVSEDIALFRLWKTPQQYAAFPQVVHFPLALKSMRATRDLKLECYINRIFLKEENHKS